MSKCGGAAEYQNGYRHFGSRRTSEKTLSAEQLQYSSCMQQKEEEPEPLFYHLPLSRILHWNRWRHLVAKTVKLVLRRKAWAALGAFLKLKTDDYSDGIVRLRKLWNWESRELKRIKHLSDAELQCHSP